MIMAWWFISAHKWFKGPTINVEHAMLGRTISQNAQVLDGVEEKIHASDSGSEDLSSKAKEASLDRAPNAPIHTLAD